MQQLGGITRVSGIPLLGKVAAVILLAAIAGCGSNYPRCVGVRGHVTYQGKPLPTGMVSFTRLGQPSGGELVRPATGDIKSDGSYAMRTFGNNEGVLPGEYAATIVAFEYRGKQDEFQKLPSLIPTKYGSPQTSGLKATVPSDAHGELTIDFDLTD